MSDGVITNEEEFKKLILITDVMILRDGNTMKLKLRQDHPNHITCTLDFNGGKDYLCKIVVNSLYKGYESCEIIIPHTGHRMHGIRILQNKLKECSNAEAMLREAQFNHLADEVGGHMPTELTPQQVQGWSVDLAWEARDEQRQEHKRRMEEHNVSEAP